MAIDVVFFDLGETLVTAGRNWLPGAKALPPSLRAAGHRLGIISNTGGLHTGADILKFLPTDFDLSAFEPNLTLFPSEVGKEKPRPAIFQEAVTRVARPAKQSLYSSESIIETLVAQATGMR